MTRENRAYNLCPGRGEGLAFRSVVNEANAKKETEKLNVEVHQSFRRTRNH